MNLGIASLGVVGGLVVGVGLWIQARRDRAFDSVLREQGIMSTAVVVSVVAVGRHLTFRRVTFALDDGGRFVQTFPFTDPTLADLDEGARVAVRHLATTPSGVVRGRLAASPAAPGPTATPVLVGMFIAALGLAAALVV